MFRGIAPTERGGYSLWEMAQQRGPSQYFNRLLGQRPREIGHLKSFALKARFIAVIAQYQTDEDESLF